MSIIKKVIRRLLAKRSSAAGARLPAPFSFEGEVGFLDSVEGSPLPIVRLSGWFSGIEVPRLALRTSCGIKSSPNLSLRSRRLDVSGADRRNSEFCGFRIDYLLEGDEKPISILCGESEVFTFGEESKEYGLVTPHYVHLLEEKRILGRGSIYGSGPPVDVSDEFKSFASLASGRILDFGCGNGDLLLHLRRRGCDAEGVELDEPRIRNHLKPGSANFVTLYRGGTQLPFDDRTFDSIVSTEVIEHIPNIQEYITEFARILSPGGRVYITTPDITSIPSCFPANVVPWHLLESTHVNFFTHASVSELFSPHFDLERSFCLGGFRVNGLFVPGSIGAVFIRK
ncbi:class I SAM-dependent methyltransferase [Luteimonas sp. XNQY3]|nr:class I SAM-dependent methyltransferase [Luteimonas sp. XNQY3]MCD9004922.1 class I SAM-dependent methyltransferase [Luteimonas sp. XNQY3]